VRSARGSEAQISHQFISMESTYNNLMRIVSAATPREQRLLAIRDVALDLNWTPSYEFHGAFGADVADDHLVVEHGLENSAIISHFSSRQRELSILIRISSARCLRFRIIILSSGTYLFPSRK